MNKFEELQMEDGERLGFAKQVEPGISTKLKFFTLWLYDFITLNKLTYSLEYNNFINKDLKNWPLSRKDAIRELTNYAVRYGFPANAVVIRNNWDSFCAIEHQKHLNSIKTSVLGSSPTTEDKNAAEVNLSNLIWYMTGKRNELDIACLKQFMWCVKKNLAEQTNGIAHVMMPVLFGGQDTGKTTIINWLCSPLEDLTINADFNVFKDERNLKAFQQMFIIKLDEMGKAKDTAVECIKKIMSKTNLLQREFHSQDDFAKIKSRATFIAATNRPLSDVIVDDEMRRFWQIEMANYAWVHSKWHLIKAMNWHKLWDCVSIDDQEPADLVWHKFKKTQAIYADGNHVNDFITERLELQSDEWHEAVELYKQYQVWCEHHNLTKQLTRLKFAHKIKPLVLSKHSNGVKYNYSIKPFKDIQDIEDEIRKMEELDEQHE